jgi:hypothetical protein
MVKMTASKKDAFTKLEVTYRPIESLIPYARNSRTHSDAQVAQIAASIREFGWTNPVLIDTEGGIIAGHGRIMAGRKLGIKEAPCIVLDNLTDAKRRAYIIADNKLALNAGWDVELLKIELKDLDAEKFDLTLTGFEIGELATLFDEQPEEMEIKEEQTKGSLADRFGVPPFSVLNAREGWWQDRKRAWLAIGIQSELGRGENGFHAAPGGSPMVSGYDKDGKRLTGLKNIGGGNGKT